MRTHTNRRPRKRWLNTLRIASFSAAMSGLGTIVVADALAAEGDEPVARALELEEAATDERLRFAGFAAIPEAEPAPVVAADEPEPEPKPKKKKKKIGFGRLDAY